MIDEKVIKKRKTCITAFPFFRDVPDPKCTYCNFTHFTMRQTEEFKNIWILDIFEFLRILCHLKKILVKFLSHVFVHEIEQMYLSMKLNK